MILKLKLSVACLLLAALTNAQATFQWAKQMGGTGNEEGNAIAIDASGNAYTTGSFRGVADFDPGTGTYTLSSNGAMSDIFISKMDASGNFMWAKSVGSIPADEGGNGIAVDASGNVYVTGTFNGTVDFDPGAATYTLASSAYTSGFVLKLDASGNFVWAKKIVGITGSLTSYALAIDASANVYTTGFFSGTADLDPGTATYTLTSNGSTDIFVSKLDASGNFVWGKTMGGSNIDVAYAITTDASGNVYTTGNFQSTGDFDPGAATYTITAGGTQDIFISKLDANGNFAWAKTMVGNSGNYCGGRAIKVDASNNVYTGGFFGGSVDFNPGAATYTLNAAGSNAFISKLDAAGNYVWAKQINTTSSSVVYGLALDAGAHVYATGSYGGTADFDPGAATSYSTATGGDDAYLLKLDAAGNYVWAQDLGGPASYSNGAKSIALNTVSGEIYLTGQFDATFDFDFGTGILNLTPAGNNSFDVFVEKIGQSGFCTAPSSPTNTTPIANQTICSGNTSSLSVTGSGTISWYATSTSTTVLGTGINYTTPALTAGTYTYYAEANTCTVSVMRTAITLTVNPSPTITVNSGSICNGKSFTITANGASTYTISGIATGSTSIVSPSSSINYPVTGTSALGCVSSNTAISSVTVNAVPTITVNSGNICSGNSFTLTPGGASTYTVTGGSTVVSPTSTTNYSITGTSSFGCLSSNTAIGTVTVDAVPVISVNSGSICSGNSFTIVPTGAHTYTISGGSAVVNPATTTSYSIIGSSIAGCVSSNTAISTIIVHSRPTISVNSGTVCSGSSFTIIANGANTYNYAGGSAMVTPTLITLPSAVVVYTVTGLSAEGCSSTNTASCSLTVYSLPLVIATSNSTLLCVGETAVLTASGANTYNWNTGANTATLTATPAMTTTYSVTGKNTVTGCSNVAAITLSVNACTGLSEQEETAFSVYPNPNQGNFSVKPGKHVNRLEIEVMDVTGKVVYTNQFENTEEPLQIKLTDYSKGIYIVKLSHDDKPSYKKIIIH